MKRNKHSLSHYKLATMDMGYLVPVGLLETLPGDTFQHSTSMLMRLTPQLFPVMHPVTVRIHHWFVPHRLTYAGWEDFITGGPLGTGSALPYPTNSGVYPVAKGSPFDYLGVPIASYDTGSLNMMPLRAYNLIYNEYYRDQDLQAVITPDVHTLHRIAWEKDYFTTARPWSQKGPAITIPIGTSAPIIADVPGFNHPVFKGAVSGQVAPLSANTAAANAPVHHNAGAAHSAGEILQWDTQTGLRANLSAAVSPSITAFRQAFALQRYQEARATYGSRYTEYLRYLGVNPSDARLQRPQYLGGGKQSVSFSEVLDTAGVVSSIQPVGAMKGHGIAAMRSNRYRYFCEEHGFILTLMSVRPRTMYNNGIERLWSRRTKEDYWQKELELIGQQEIRNKELFWSNVPATDDGVFGYQDRYAEYRHKKSTLAGDFRDSILNFAHFGRIFASLPVLNASFISCDPGKRPFAIATNHSLWCMISHSVQARRMVTKNVIGRII